MSIALETDLRLPRCSEDEIINRVRACPRLPSLRSIDRALRELLNADNRFTTQISDVIRRDPSLTARLLRLVNSVYFSLSSPINTIEEAVFYLGVRQIRQLTLVTPIIEDFQKLTGATPFPWRNFWQHCIGTAILTREISNSIIHVSEESDYLSGLVHDVGKIVMAATFPRHFHVIYSNISLSEDRLDQERDLLGMDHAELGGIYLESHHLPEIMIDTARFHHDLESAPRNKPLIAAVQVADLLSKTFNSRDKDNPKPIDETVLTDGQAWQILFQNKSETEEAIMRGSLKRTLEMLPSILDGIV